MSLINVTNVGVLNNPAKFDTPFQFDIAFECLAEIDEDIEWKLVYVGSAESDEHDQARAPRAHRTRARHGGGGSSTSRSSAGGGTASCLSSKPPLAPAPRTERRPSRA
jgi:hypothetical protein